MQRTVGDRQVGSYGETGKRGNTRGLVVAGEGVEDVSNAKVDDVG